ncbi:MAG: energy transducer TonB [Spirochaetes bacterium]|nr:MAG: energy transducer TonB [Spirochaetota bacterium]
MERPVEIKFTLVVLVSMCLHAMGILAVVLPDYHQRLDELAKHHAASQLFGGRQIIANINEDEQQVVNDTTMLGEKDSSAKGYMSLNQGDTWLNNSRDFVLQRGRGKSGTMGRASSQDLSEALTGEDSEVQISIAPVTRGGVLGDEGSTDLTRVPDKLGYSRDNALFFTNSGSFSFNTKKYPHFRYFKAMMDRIGSNWFPPMLANSVISGFDPITGTYTPGRLRIMAIPNQEVRLFFVLNRAGEVQHVQIVDSLGTASLDSSCLDSVTISKEFGPIPEDIKGERIVIPCVFLYIIN